MLSRRNFLGTATALAGAAAITARAQAANIPEAPTMEKAATQPPLRPASGPDYNPVVTLNGWSLPWRMNGDWKEFHLVAEPVVREFAPGMKANLWGYNGQAPGPTIEAVEGDMVRIFVTNRLPEATTVHWHGMILPSGMDGVGGLSQPHIPPGKTFVYEFQLKHSGTFMYHPHSDEMVQMAMGMMGMFVVHPRDPKFRPVDRDFVFVMSSYLIDPGTYLPKVTEMTDFNMWTWNSRVFPGIDPMPVRLGDRVRVRIGNLTMTNHPIHLHGHKFVVSCTDGGWVPESAQWPETTTDVPVGAIRAFDVLADNPGDWAFHCHKSHHTMNAMGHDMRNLIGVSRKDLAKAVGKLAPDAMVMGSTGMAMGTMEMPAPDNTLPMMTGTGQFGPIEMGGMFTVMKIREGLARDDYSRSRTLQIPGGHRRLRSRRACPQPGAAGNAGNLPAGEEQGQQVDAQGDEDVGPDRSAQPETSIGEINEEDRNDLCCGDRPVRGGAGSRARTTQSRILLRRRARRSRETLAHHRGRDERDGLLAVAHRGQARRADPFRGPQRRNGGSRIPAGDEGREPQARRDDEEESARWSTTIRTGCGSRPRSRPRSSGNSPRPASSSIRA